MSNSNRIVNFRTYNFTNYSNGSRQTRAIHWKRQHTFAYLQYKFLAIYICHKNWRKIKSQLWFETLSRDKYLVFQFYALHSSGPNIVRPSVSHSSSKIPNSSRECIFGNPVNASIRAHPMFRDKESVRCQFCRRILPFCFERGHADLAGMEQ